MSLSPTMSSLILSLLGIWTLPCFILYTHMLVVVLFWRSMSAEPGRKTAYSNYLRWRIVYQRIAMNLPLVKIAQNLNVAVSTVHRIYRLFEESGTVDPLSPRKRLDCRRLSDLRSELYVVGVILENPSMYLGELCVEIMHVFGIEISPSTVCRTLRRYGLTRKKIRQVALQRSSELRGAFMAQCFLLKRDMLVWTIGIYGVLYLLLP